MRRTSLLAAFMAALISAAPPIATAREPDLEVEMISLDPVLETRIEVSRRLWAKERPRGLARLLPTSGAIVIPPGTYRVEQGLRAPGREWLLVPYRLRAEGVDRSPDSVVSAVSGCSSRFRRFLALDRSSLQFEPRIWRVHAHRCTDGLVEPTIEGEWSTSIQIQEPGQSEVRAHRSAQDAIAAESAEVARAHAEAQARAREEQARSPLKRQIGARLCKRQGEWEFIGFTEAVSPDNAKIRIRIVQQRRAGTTSVNAGDFNEQITWEHPEQWTLCE